jgi:hypothetical protein
MNEGGADGRKANERMSMQAGSWLQNYPGFLERLYRATARLFHQLEPLIGRIGYGRVNRWIRPPEELSKALIFDCRMCGQCILPSTGMTCPMTCPKNIRNGPCGGVRPNGNCEVIAEMRCIWVDAYELSEKMPIYGQDILQIQPPLNRLLEGSSAWVNMLRDDNALVGWIDESGQR